MLSGPFQCCSNRKLIPSKAEALCFSAGFHLPPTSFSRSFSPWDEMKWVKWPTAISAQSLHGALKCDLLPQPLHRWGSNVKWSVHRQREVTQRAKGIVGRTGPEREKVRESREWRDWKDGERREKIRKGCAGQTRAFLDGTGHSVMTLISWDRSRSRSLALISVSAFILIAMHMDTQILQTNQKSFPV